MRPNFLFIVADDLNSWIGALGRHPDVKTPNIDALAARGTLFTNAYCAAPYCNASRMAVFTGCLPNTTGIYVNEPLWEIPGRRRTFLELLREAGYFTMGAGKVFHGVFDYNEAGRSKLPRAKWVEMENRPALWDQFMSNVIEPLPEDRPLNGIFDFTDIETVPPVYRHFDWGPLPDDRIDQMPDAQVVTNISAFLNSAPRQPFFCAAGIYKPHLPWHVPARFFDLYDEQKIALPFVKADDLDDVPPIAQNLAREPLSHSLVIENNAWRPAVRGYLASVSYCDFVIGQIVQQLKASGLADNTVIVLWGDNGFHLGEKLHWSKFVLWEEATRVPLVIVRPGVKPHRFYDPVCLIDIFPTILEMAGIQDASRIDGISLVPFMSAGKPRQQPAAMIWGKGNRSIRTPNWRLTRYSDGTEELYDHRSDAYEWTNLALVPTFDGVRDQLRPLLPE